MSSVAMGVRRPRARRRLAVAALLVASLAVLAASVGRPAVAAPAPGAMPMSFIPASAHVAAQSAATLLSQGKPVVASSTENAGTAASNVNDGSTTTRWSSAFSDPQWIYIDLGSSQSISQVVLNWEAAYATSFQIQTSNDATTWTTIYTTTTGTGGVQTLNIAGTGRYVRMNGTVRATTYGYSLWEFQVFGAAATSSLLSQGKPAVASSTENAGTAASNVDDGSTTTRWSSVFSDPQWIYIDLGATASITQVVLNWEAAYAKSFQIQTSPDAATWTSIYTTTTGTGGVQTLNITGSGRYVRMNGTVRATAYGYSLWEMQVFGTGGSGGDTTPPSTPGTLSASGTTSTSTTLSWGASTDNVGVTGYDVIRNGATVGTVTGTSTTQTGLTPSTAYTFQVKARDAAGNLSAGSNTVSVTTSAGSGTCTQSDTPAFGPNVHIFDPSMSAATIQAQLDADFNATKDTNTAQFSNTRVAELFKPGTYGVNANVGFYESVAGIGQNPDDVMINGNVTVDAFNASDAGNATQNFWRSAENLAITPSSGSDRWAVAQAAPFRRIDVHGGLQLAPASNGYASGGYIADTKVTGQVTSVSQQQWYSRDSNFGSWSGGVWNMVFSGVTGAPAASFPSPPETVLATTPVSRDVPYLYVTSDGKYHVFLPSLRTNASGTSWPNTPGTSLPMSQFYVVKAGDTAATINNALSTGCNLFFTPGVYHVSSAINVTRAGTVVLGIGYPTIIPDGGAQAITVGDVDGVRLKGLLISAGTTNSPALVTVGTAGNTTSHAGNPTTIQDVFFRIGGDAAGKATQSLIVNQNDTIIDHIWAWRADHGNGVGWTSNTADTGLTVNGNNVLATGLFVEHYQKYEVVWNGQNGKTIFFQNENPYDPPNQAAWMNGSLNGYAAYKVGAGVTSHEAWGMGSYCYFNVNPAVNNYHAFEAPVNANVKFHNLLTVSLGGVGTITHVINDTGAVTPSNTTPSTVTTYP